MARSRCVASACDNLARRRHAGAIVRLLTRSALARRFMLKTKPRSHRARKKVLCSDKHCDRRSRTRRIVASQVAANAAELCRHGFPDVVVGVKVRVWSFLCVDPVKVHHAGPNAFSLAKWRV